MTGEITSMTVRGETHAVWTIDDFMKIQDVAIISKAFHHEDHSFKLRIFPKGDTWFEALTPAALCICLIGKGTWAGYTSHVPKYNSIEYIMGIKKADASEFREESVSRSDAIGWTPTHELITRYMLDLCKSDMVPGGTLTVFCNIRYAKEKPAVSVGFPTASTYDGGSALIEKLKDVYLSQRYTDVKIAVNDKEFRAHKVFLCAQSEVFAAMFENDTSENRTGIVIIDEDFDPVSFEYFLLYLYTGKLDTVSFVNAVSLYKIAYNYAVEKLKQVCIGYMIKGMSVNSFCSIFHLATLYNEYVLLSGATDFFIDNANTILTTKEWLTLLKDHPSSCNELLVKFAKNVRKK